MGATLALTGCNFAPNAGLETRFQITLAPADFDRVGEVMAFKFPEGVPTFDAVLRARDANATILPLQINASGSAITCIPRQDAGQTLKFDVLSSSKEISMALANVVTVNPEDGRLRFEVGGKPVFFYQMTLAKPPRDGVADKILRGAFLYPIFTPDGVQMSDSYPADHPHDHGIWTAWTDTQFQGRNPDFWNPHYPNGGTVEFVALDNSWSGPVVGGFESRHRYMDRLVTPPMAALNENWRVSLYAAPGVKARVFDLEVNQTPAAADPLILLQYRYGGLGVRGSAQWEDKSNLWVLTSSGITDRVKADAQPAKWFFMGGNIDGKPAGIAVLDDPANFRAPQPVRMNPDGPFFMYAPVISGGFTISADHPYHARYRFIVQDGLPDAKFLEACWQGFAHPPEVTVSMQEK